MLSNTPTNNQTETQQPDPTRFQCRHIRASGQRCAMACLRDEPFCYYHHTTRRPAPKPGTYRYPDAAKDPFTMPVVEDRAAIQLAISQTLSRIASNDLDLKRAKLILYGLQIAVAALPKEPRPAPIPAHQQSTPTPEPHPLNDLPEELSEDPIHGQLAPIAEFLPPKPAEEHSPAFLRYLEEIREARPFCPLCYPEDPYITPPIDTLTDDQRAGRAPIILPGLQACTEPGAPCLEPETWVEAPQTRVPHLRQQHRLRWEVKPPDRPSPHCCSRTARTDEPGRSRQKGAKARVSRMFGRSFRCAQDDGPKKQEQRQPQRQRKEAGPLRG